MDTGSTSEKKPSLQGDAPGAGRHRIRRYTAYAFFLVASVLLLLGGAEGLLRLVMPAPDTHFTRLTERNGVPVQEVNPGFYQQFLSHPVGRIMDLDDLGFDVPVEKSGKAFRIFILGSSAAHGCTPDHAYGFGRILEVMLKTRFPGVEFEICNAACPAISTHVVRLAARACAKLKPDLFIVYTGNNEYMGPFGPAWTQGNTAPLAVIHAWPVLRSLRLARFLTPAAENVWLPRIEHGGAFLQHLRKLPSQDPLRTKVRDYYEANLDDICRYTLDSGARVLLCTVASNLRDWPPAASLHRPNLTPEQESPWKTAFETGLENERTGMGPDSPPQERTAALRRALDAFTQAAAVDDTYAALQFHLGRCHWELGERAEALPCFTRARDLDCLPLRVDSDMNNRVREMAKRYSGRGLVLTDVAGALGAAPGADLFWDFVHFTFDGNYAVAALLFKQVTAALPEPLRGNAGEEAAPLSKEECVRRLALTPAVLAHQARAMMPAFQFWGVGQEEISALEGHIKTFDEAAGPDPFAQSAQAFQAALSLNPDDYYLNKRYAQLLLEHHAAKEAQDQVQRLVQRFPQRRGTQWVLAQALEENKAWDAAVDAYRALTLHFPEDAAAYARLGALLKQQNKTPQAIEAFRQCLKLDPYQDEAKTGLEEALRAKTGP